MFRLLIDTCVWLDLAMDSQQEPLLQALEELIDGKSVELILPQPILDEFARNKARVAEDATRSISSTLKRAREFVGKFGSGRHQRIALAELNEIDHRLPSLGDAATEAIARIERLFQRSTVIEVSDAIKLRAMQRAIEKRAPFHRQRNGIDDAILIEVYASVVSAPRVAGVRFGFVTHNTKDFSHPTGNNRLPHPDIAGVFSRIRSLYFITLGDALRRIEPGLVSDIAVAVEWNEGSRRASEIVAAISELVDKVWYNRHQNLRYKIARGKIKVVEKAEWSVANSQHTIQREILGGAVKSAQRMEKKYGRKNLGPWSDFEWGMINGKLSALRWVLGDEWDMLDT